MKQYFCTAVGVAGSAIISLFGGWDMALQTLIIFMAVDYITGLIVAGIFKRSSKTKKGALESRAGWFGLCRKGVVLLIVLVAHHLDLLLEINFVRMAVTLGFVANEAISIIENAGLMGIPIGSYLTDAIEILKGKSNKPNE